MTGRDRRRAERAGRRAEWLAAWLLRCKGYRVIARRCRTPAGEIDLIVRRGETLVFVEVKRRATLAEAMESVGLHQRRRIVAAAGWFIAGQPRLAGFCLRFDVMLMPISGWPRHIPAAFMAEGD